MVMTISGEEEGPYTSLIVRLSFAYVARTTYTRVKIHHNQRKPKRANNRTKCYEGKKNCYPDIHYSLHKEQSRLLIHAQEYCI